MIDFGNGISIDESEVELTAVRAQGAGGQNVNKVASAIHLRFDIAASSLPGPVQDRLLKISDQRISSDGVVVIKAQRHRTQERNRTEALERLVSLVQQAMAVRRKRIPTRPTRASEKKRLEQKTRRGQVKALRRKITD